MIPASVSEIGVGAFAECASLTQITVNSGNAFYTSLDGVLYTADKKTLHTYPAGKEAWSYTVRQSTAVINFYAFAGAYALHEVILPEQLDDINDYSFFRTGLYVIKIPDNVTHIGRYSFAQSWELTDILLGENSKLPRIGFAAFAQTRLNSFTVPKNVRAIAQEAFSGCKQLTSITFAENSKLESITAYMFKGCENLLYITFLGGSELRSIQAHGLEGMYNLRDLDFSGTKLENIDNYYMLCE